MIVGSRVKPVVKDYGTVYEAELKVDISPQRRALLQQNYQRQVVQGRLILFGGALGLRPDLPGGRLRLHPGRRGDQGLLHQPAAMLAAGGVGAAGMAIYQVLA